MTNSRIEKLEKLIASLELNADNYEIDNYDEYSKDIANAIFSVTADNTVNNRLLNIYMHSNYCDIIFCDRTSYEKATDYKQNKKNEKIIEYLQTATVKQKDSNNKRICLKFELDEKALKKIIKDYLTVTEK